MTSQKAEAPKKEVELTEYEFKRLQELTTAIEKGEEGLKQFGALLR